MSDYINSFGEYFDHVKNPDLPFQTMIKLSGNPGQLFTQWSVFQFLLYLVIATVWAIVVIIHEASLAGTVISLLIGILISYILSHLGWYIIVRQNGCCSPVVSFIIGVFFLLWGLSYLLFGISGTVFFDSEGNSNAAIGGVWTLIRIVLFVTYGATLIYMGISAMMCCGSTSGGFRGADDLTVADATKAQDVHVHVHIGKNENGVNGIDTANGNEDYTSADAQDGPIRAEMQQMKWGQPGLKGAPTRPMR